MKSAAIVYGWSEGPWQSTKMRATLDENGISTINDTNRADIIIAHSSGCYLVPKKTAAELIVLIGPPFWPGRSLFVSAFLNIVENIHTERRESFSWWAGKLLHNLMYIIIRPKATFDVIFRLRPKNLPRGGTAKIILIRNTHDTFTHADVSHLLPPAQAYESVVLEGVHDDCWFKPQKYVETILKHL